jgi:hypothetical protein
MGSKLYLASVLILVSTAFFTLRCGTAEDVVYEAPPNNPPDEEPREEPDGKPQYADIADDVKRECGRCHNGAIHPKTYDTEEKFRSAKARVVNGSMPPDRPLPSAIKAKFILFLGS